jgi:hypothetical protein
MESATNVVFYGGLATGTRLSLAFSMVCSFRRQKAASPETAPGRNCQSSQ